MLRQCALLLGAGFLLACCPQALCHGRRAVVAVGYTNPAFYGPQLLYVGPTLPVVPIACPVPMMPGPLVFPGLAVPTAAPPSGPTGQTAEPPLNKGTGQAPKVIESRSIGIKAAAGEPAECCKVGFWNVTGRTLTLTIDGKAQVLTRNQSLTVRLGRRFSWQVDQCASQAEQVPTNRNTLEIVIRR